MALKYEDLFEPSPSSDPSGTSDDTVHMISDPGNVQEQKLADICPNVAEQSTEKEFPSRTHSTQSREHGSQGYEADREDKNIESFRQVASGRWDENKAVVKRYVLDLFERNDAPSRLLLEKALKNGGRYTQSLVCKTLGQMGDWGLRTLVKNLLNEKGTLHAECYAALKKISPWVCEELLDLLEKPSELDLSLKQKLVMMEILSHLAHQRIPAFFCERLKHPLSQIREGALKGLRRQGVFAETQVIQFLRKLSAEHDAFEQLIIFLTDIRSTRVVPFLQNLFKEKTSPVLLALASWSLGELKAISAAPVLINQLFKNGQSIAVQKSILEALRKLNDSTVVPDLIELLDHRELREEVIRTLGALGGESARLALEPLLQSDVAYVRCLAAESLVQIGHVDSMRKVFDCLYDIDPLVQRYVHKVLENVYSPEEIETLFQLLEADYAEKAQKEAEEEMADLAEQEAEEELQDWRQEEVLRRSGPSFFQRLKQSAQETINTVKNQVSRPNPYKNPFGNPGGKDWDPWAELAKYNQNPGGSNKGSPTSGQFPW